MDSYPVQVEVEQCRRFLESVYSSFAGPVSARTCCTFCRILLALFCASSSLRLLFSAPPLLCAASSLRRLFSAPPLLRAYRRRHRQAARACIVLSHLACNRLRRGARLGFDTPPCSRPSPCIASWVRTLTIAPHVLNHISSLCRRMRWMRCWGTWKTTRAGQADQAVRRARPHPRSAAPAGARISTRTGAGQSRETLLRRLCSPRLTSLIY